MRANITPRNTRQRNPTERRRGHPAAAESEQPRLVANPPRPNRILLVTSITLLVLWDTFLVALAIRS